MKDIKIILLCSKTNIQKWVVNPRIYSIAIFIIAFLGYHSFGLSQFAVEMDFKLTPWVFPHLFTPPVLQIFALFALLLFCDAPFVDKHMPFLITRTGRRNLIIGQFCYIIFASIIYTLFVFIVSILVFIPNLQIDSNWGAFMQILSENLNDIPETVTIFFDSEIIHKLTALQATIISLGLFCLVSIFIGVTTFLFNILIGRMSGIVVVSFFIFISYFVVYVGGLTLGKGINFISPISWMSLSSLDWSNTGRVPTPIFASICLFLLIIFMGTLAVIVFNKKDVQFQK